MATLTIPGCISPSLSTLPLPSMRDHALVKMAQQGDLDAFSELYKRHQSSVKSICVRMMKDVTLAEDHVSNTFLRAFTHIDSFKQKSAFRTWLIRIAMNSCKQELRKKPKIYITIEVLQKNGKEPAVNKRTVENIDDAIAVKEALDGVPALNKEFLSLRAEGYSLLEIAHMKGRSVPACKSLVFNARKRMRVTLQPLSKSRR